MSRGHLLPGDALLHKVRMLHAQELDGKALVETNCSPCHAVGATGTSPDQKAPRFRDLHARHPSLALREPLSRGIATPHDEMPKFAVEPVVDIKTPIRTLSPLLPCVWQALSKLAITNEAIRMRFIQILTGLEFLTNFKSEPEPVTVLVFNLAEGRPKLLIFCSNRAE